MICGRPATSKKDTHTHIVVVSKKREREKGGGREGLSMRQVDCGIVILHPSFCFFRVPLKFFPPLVFLYIVGWSLHPKKF